MSAAKHTPGPWKLFKHGTKEGYVLMQRETRQHLMYIQEAPGMGDQAVPNFYVLEAATDLLAALRSAHHMLTRDYIDDAKMAVIEKCDAAIQKATGAA